MKITLVGAGNVATHLGKALHDAGHEIAEVWSRTEESAKALAETLGCKARTFDAVIEEGAHTPPYSSSSTDATCNGQAQACQQASSPSSTSAIYIISIKDDAIESTASRLIPLAPQAIWLHTAGTMPLSILANKGAERIGVLYPMQTFSKAKSVDFSCVSVFIESQGFDEELSALASSISPHVYSLNSEGRKHLHLAAVFACNFVNHCYTLSAKVLQEIGIPFDVMLPLIDETARKVHELPPRAAQTGPAIRGDKTVMNRQMSIIQDDTTRNIYQLMSHSIAQPEEETPKRKEVRGSQYSQES